MLKITLTNTRNKCNLRTSLTLLSLFTILSLSSNAQTLSYSGAGFDGFNADIIVTNYNKSDKYATGIRFQSRYDDVYKAFSLYNNFQDLSFTYSGSSDVKAQGNKLMILKPDGRLLLTKEGNLGGEINLGAATFSVGAGTDRLLFDPDEMYSSSSLSIGKSYSSDIIFKNVNSSGSTDLMVIDGNGDIGIGTSTPVSRFHINKSGTMNGVLNAEKAFFHLESGGYQLMMDPNEIYTSRELYIGSGHNYDINFRNVGTVGVASKNLMTIKSTGNVGIGTISPEAKLHVNGNYYGRGHLALYAFEGEGKDGTAYIQARDYKSNSTADISMLLRTQNGGATVNAVKIRPNGWVGIGTTNAEALLHVNGNTIMKDVIADKITLTIGSFPDYVFRPDYKLQPLLEVANYIHTNGRLPKMPSEEEVVENGMNIGQVNVLLVEKVEELTLYTIEQEKKIDSLEEKMKVLEATMSELVKQLKQ